MPYVKAEEWRRTQALVARLHRRVRDLEATQSRDRAALAGKMRIELEKLGDHAVVFHFFEPPGTRWVLRQGQP